MTRIYTLSVQFEDDDEPFSLVSVLESSVTPEPELATPSQAMCLKEELDRALFTKVLVPKPEPEPEGILLETGKEENV